MGIRCAGHVTPLYPQKLALTSPTGGGRSVGIVRSRTKATEFFFMSFHSNIGYVNAPEYQIVRKLHLLLDNVTGFLHLHQNTKTWLRDCSSSSIELAVWYLYYIYRVSQQECARFGRVFLMLKYTDITQNTYIQS